MKQKRMPTEAEFQMLEAMFSKDPAAWSRWIIDQGYVPDLDLPLSLSNIPIEQWPDLSKVIPTSGIQAYLASGDQLTNFTIDMMELAMERDYGVTMPWFIDCERTGREEDGNLKVDCFRVCKAI
jgi:hypothetical protein